MAEATVFTDVLWLSEAPTPMLNEGQKGGDLHISADELARFFFFLLEIRQNSDDLQGDENDDEEEEDEDEYDARLGEIFDTMFERYQSLQKANSRRKRAALLSQEETEAELSAREAAESQHDRCVLDLCAR